MSAANAADAANAVAFVTAVMHTRMRLLVLMLVPVLARLHSRTRLRSLAKQLALAASSCRPGPTAPPLLLPRAFARQARQAAGSAAAAAGGWAGWSLPAEPSSCGSR